jgi:hypothetical protein
MRFGICRWTGMVVRFHEIVQRSRISTAAWFYCGIDESGLDVFTLP